MNKKYLTTIALSPIAINFIYNQLKVINSLLSTYPIADKSIGSINANDINRHIGNLIKPNGDKYSLSFLELPPSIKVIFKKVLKSDILKTIGNDNIS